MMKRLLIILLLLGCSVAMADMSVTLNIDPDVAIEFVTVGDVGNPADEPDWLGDRLGAVDYVYQIMMYEMTCDQLATLKPNRVFGCELLGESHPSTLSYSEAAEFVNILNDDQGYPAAYRFDGNRVVAWPEDHPGYNVINPIRDSRAKFFIASPDEWHKAAYYDPSIAGYWDSALGTDSPIPVDGPTTDPLSYVCCLGEQSVFTSGGASPYGTFGQTGNAREWEENGLRLRAGHWDLYPAYWSRLSPLSPAAIRLVAIPEPVETHSLLAAILFAVMQSRQFRRSRQ